MVIPKNTVEERTKINLSENSLKHQTILSNHDNDNNSTDNEQMEQIVHNNPAENVNPIINNEMVLPNNQQESLRDTLEVVPLFNGSNIPLSHFIEGCYEAKAMLPTPAAQETLARLLRSKLSGEARKCVFESTYNNIEELIEKLKRVYAPAKSVYQLKGELGNTYMWEKENVLSYAARIKEIVDRIEDAHRLNNNGQVDNTFKRNLQRDVIQCFIRGLRPELEIRVKTKEKFKEVFNDTINVERDLVASSALRRNKNSDYLKMDDPINNKKNKRTRFNVARDNNVNCIICKKPGHVAESCYYLTKAQEAVSKELNPNFVMQNQQPSNNLQQRENIYNNSARNNYRNNHFSGNRNNNCDNNNSVQNNYPNKNFSRNRNNNYNNFSSNRSNYPKCNRFHNYNNNNFSRNRNNDNRQENLDHNRYANHTQFSNQNSQLEMRNQQSSRANQNYPVRMH